MTYGRRRRVSPKEAARRERERERENACDRAQDALKALLTLYRRDHEVTGDEARFAWSCPQDALFVTGYMSDGTQWAHIVRRADDGRMWIQEPHFPGWKFSRLVPVYDVRREVTS